MVAAKSSRVNRQYKKKYRIRNWREYERGLRSRGDVTIWLSEDAIAAWVPPKNGLRGGQRRYSNLAVRTALTLRVVFSLPLRQTEGFLDSLLRLMGLNLKAPDHTTLSRRNQIVAVPPLTRSHDGPIDLIVDSTGLKILGCGAWNAHKHKASKKRRDWRKLHIGVDAEGFIVAAELTASSRDDASTLPALLDTIEVPIRRFTADGAYDHRSVYDQLSAAGTENVVIVIPPRRSAVSAGPTDGPWAQRDTALERIRQVGRREWQKESGYRQQARVENSFFRYKPVLGGGLKARHKGEKLRSGVTSSTGWPSWVGRNPALWCPEREVGKAPPLAPQLNHATAPLLCGIHVCPRCPGPSSRHEGRLDQASGAAGDATDRLGIEAFETSLLSSARMSCFLPSNLDLPKAPWAFPCRRTATPRRSWHASRGRGRSPGRAGRAWNNSFSSVFSFSYFWLIRALRRHHPDPPHNPRSF